MKYNKSPTEPVNFKKEVALPVYPVGIAVSSTTVAFVPPQLPSALPTVSVLVAEFHTTVERSSSPVKG